MKHVWQGGMRPLPCTSICLSQTLRASLLVGLLTRSKHALFTSTLCFSPLWDLKLQDLGNKWWVPQPIFLNIQMMSQQLLVWFGDVDGWPHEGHDTESPSPLLFPLLFPFSLGVWHSAIVSDTISVFRTSDRMQDLVHGCNHYSNCTHASLLIPNFLFHFASILLEVNSTKIFHGQNCQKV